MGVHIVAYSNLEMVGSHDWSDECEDHVRAYVAAPDFERSLCTP